MGIYGIIDRDHESYPNWVMGEISTIPNRMNKLGLQHKTPFSTRFLKTLWGYWNRAQERCLLRLNIEFNWIYHRSSRNIQERYGRLDHNGPHVRQNYYQRWIHWLNQSEPRWWSQTPCETSILKWSLGWGSTRPHSGKKRSIRNSQMAAENARVPMGPPIDGSFLDICSHPSFGSIISVRQLKNSQALGKCMEMSITRLIHMDS
jgi:hypothetical protein